MASSTESHILNGVSFNMSDIGFGKPRINASNGKNVTIFNLLARTPLKLTTPPMTTWGVNVNDFEGNGKQSYDLTITFPSKEYENEDTRNFLKNLKDLEDLIKLKALENSKDWFGKPKMSAEVLDALFTPMVRYSKNKETGEVDLTKPPGLRIKITYYDGQFKNVEVFDTERKMIDPGTDQPLTEVIPKGTQIVTVISCGGIWFANGKFGVTWKLFQAMVKPKTRLQSGICHCLVLGEDNKEETNEKGAEEPEKESESVKEDTTSTVEVVDTDEEQDPDKEYQADVPDVPTKGKKKVVKK